MLVGPNSWNDDNDDDQVALARLDMAPPSDAYAGYDDAHVSANSAAGTGMNASVRSRADGARSGSIDALSAVAAQASASSGDPARTDPGSVSLTPHTGPTVGPGAAPAPEMATSGAPLRVPLLSPGSGPSILTPTARPTLSGGTDGVYPAPPASRTPGTAAAEGDMSGSLSGAGAEGQRFSLPTSADDRVSAAAAAEAADAASARLALDAMPPRMPKSGFRILSRPWSLGAEEMVFPALCSLLWAMVLLVLSAVARILLSVDEDEPVPAQDACKGSDVRLLSGMIGAHLAIWGVHVITDIAMFFAAYRSHMFQENKLVVRLVYARLVLMLLLIGVTVFSAVAVARLEDDCFSAARSYMTHVVRLVIVIFTLAWVKLFFTLCFTTCSLVSTRENNPERDERAWHRRLRRMFCCISDDNADDVYSSLSRVFAELFRADGDDARLVASDVAVGMLLVQAAQRQARKNGRQFFLADVKSRWDGVRARRAVMEAAAETYAEYVAGREAGVVLAPSQGGPAFGSDEAAASATAGAAGRLDYDGEGEDLGGDRGAGFWTSRRAGGATPVATTADMRVSVPSSTSRDPRGLVVRTSDGVNRILSPPPLPSPTRARVLSAAVAPAPHLAVHGGRYGAAGAAAAGAETKVEAEDEGVSVMAAPGAPVPSAHVGAHAGAAPRILAHSPTQPLPQSKGQRGQALPRHSVTAAEELTAARAAAAAAANAAAAAETEAGGEEGEGDAHELQRAAGLKDQAERAAERAADPELAANAAARGLTPSSAGAGAAAAGAAAAGGAAAGAAVPATVAEASPAAGSALMPLPGQEGATARAASADDRAYHAYLLAPPTVAVGGGGARGLGARERAGPGAMVMAGTSNSRKPVRSDAAVTAPVSAGGAAGDEESEEGEDDASARLRAHGARPRGSRAARRSVSALPRSRSELATRSRDDAERRGHEQWMVDEVLNGRQPPLPAEDWDRIRLAKYFARYAYGAYGWPLFVFDNPCDGIFGCGACGLGCGRPGASLDCGFTYPRGVLENSGCCNAGCLNSSAKAFLTRTGLKPEEILHANVDSRYGTVSYFVAVDEPSRRLVVAVRGTMSLGDTITDLDARMEYLSCAPQHYAHKGMIISAEWLLRELEGASGWNMHEFLAARAASGTPLSILLTGHSLGAGVTSVLTVMLAQRYPTVQCVAFAPPLCLDPVLAEKTRESITTITYQHDLVSRLSIVALLRLKRQMFNAFKICATNKFSIVRASLARRHDDMFDPELIPEHWQLDQGFTDELFTSDLGRELGTMEPPARPKRRGHARGRGRGHGQGGSTADAAAAAIARDGPAVVVTPPGLRADVDALGPAQPPTVIVTDLSNVAPIPISPSDAAAAAAAAAAGSSSNAGALGRVGHELSVPVGLDGMESEWEGGDLSDDGSVISTAGGAFPATVSRLSAIQYATPDDDPDTRQGGYIARAAVAGRIYHILPDKTSASSWRDTLWGGFILKCLCVRFCLRSRTRKQLIYPAHYKMFDEIYVSATLFSDHLPKNTQMRDLDIPDEYFV